MSRVGHTLISLPYLKVLNYPYKKKILKNLGVSSDFDFHKILNKNNNYDEHISLTP